MKRLKKSTKTIIILAFVLGAMYGVIFLTYPGYHLSRIYALLKPKIEGEMSSDISQNGEWVIYSNRPWLEDKNKYEYSTEITIQSVDNPFMHSQFTFDRIWSPHWSPNGASFFVSNGPNIHCDYPDYGLFTLNGDKWDGPIYFGKSLENPSKDLDFCSRIAWSEDGTKLALYSRPVQGKGMDTVSIKIMDQQARVLEDFTVRVPGVENGLDYLSWNGTDFILVNYAEFHPIDQKIISRVYSFSSLNPAEVIYHGNLPESSHLEIIGRDDQTGRVLIRKSFEGAVEFLVYRIAEKKIEKDVVMRDLCWPVVARSLDNRWIWVMCRKNDNEKSLFLWDWESLEFVDRGTTGGIISWQDDLQGLLVLNEDQEGKEVLDLVRP